MERASDSGSIRDGTIAIAGQLKRCGFPFASARAYAVPQASR
jgi:hypothetical protein